VPSHASLFTGKYARAVGVDTKHQTLDCDRPTLAETLSEHGYRTRAISANQNVSAAGSWDRGFDAFYSPSDLYFRGELDVYPTVLEAADVDPPGEYDGASLFEPRGNDRYYAAYTGLLNKAVEQLREGGLDEARIDEFEEHLVAAALPDGYVYETRDGVETEGDVRDRPAEVVAAAERTLRADDAVDGESEAAPGIPERQLKDLGYM
jgi:arylsulfatase A-like enzyme